jgi:hypothetical protein
MTLITEKMVQAAFDYLNDAADAAAKARGDRILAEHRRKKVLAELLIEQEGGTVDLRRAKAEADHDYWKACQDEAEAVRMDAWHSHQKGKAMAIIDAWRTEQSNLRQTSRIG